ncbi:Sulfate permease [hydrothermal vent metagenome]|uniref:Sulfate permease n=1 Tax=hydrothermal vent metagenome TaxID=652676 RepID=A0A3B0ZRF2_9ZZZZ
MIQVQNYINGLHFNNLRGDIYGGLTAAVVALPLALAMGVASGAGPIAGMYGAIFVGFFAALLGGTPAQVSGPTGPMTVVMAGIFTQFTSLFPGDPATGAALAFTVVIMGGLFQIAFGILKIGKYIQLVPHPVVSGFMSGIGVIIILIQIGPLLGHAPTAKPLAAALAMPEHFARPQQAAMVLGLLTLAIVYLIPKFLPKLNRLMPSPLLALIVGTAFFLLFMDHESAATLGKIPSGLPDPRLPTIMLEHLIPMIIAALILAALGSIDSLLTSLVADNVTRTYHKSDRELIGQGIGNTIAGIFGGLPGAGATMRTVVNVKAGGLTPLSGALHAVILLVIVLGASGLASHIPNAVLAGILVKVGTDIIDWEYLKKVHRAPLAGVVIMLVVLVMTVFVDLMIAVGTGMVMASLVFLKRMTDLQIESLKITTSEQSEMPLNDNEKEFMTNAGGRILLFSLGGPMSFGSAKNMAKMLSTYKNYDVMVIDVSTVPLIDFTSCKALTEIITDAQSLHRHVMLVGAQGKVLITLTKQQIVGLVGPENTFQFREPALAKAFESVKNSGNIED